MPNSNAPADVSSRYHSVSLARIESAPMSFADQCVSGTVDGANQWLAFRPVFKFLPEAMDVNVERILFVRCRAAPSRFDELFTRRCQIDSPHQHLEQLHLLAGQGNLFAVPHGH